MTATSHKDCFGTMFPDDLHLKNNVPNRGKVFTANVQLVGGMARGDRSIAAGIAEWDDSGSVQNSRVATSSVLPKQR